MATRKKLSTKPRKRSVLTSDAAYKYLRGLNKPARKVYSYPANGLPPVKASARSAARRTSFMDARPS